MKIVIEDLSECVEVVRQARDFMKQRGVDRGHDVDSCVCNNCLAAKYLKKASEPLNQEWYNRG